MDRGRILTSENPCYKLPWIFASDGYDVPSKKLTYPWEKDNHLQACPGWEYVRSQEGMDYDNLSRFLEPVSSLPNNPHHAAQTFRCSRAIKGAL